LPAKLSNWVGRTGRVCFLAYQSRQPPEHAGRGALEFPGSATGPWVRYVHNPDARGIGVVRYPRLVPKDEDSAEKLQKRTLTNLYNERPTWLALAHQKLVAAVIIRTDYRAGSSIRRERSC
jgi:hypothetical protein